MKRKRGNKKGKPKKPPSVGANEAYLNVVSVNNEDNSGPDDFDNAGYDSVMDVDTPSSTGTDQPDKLAKLNPDGSVDKRMVQAVYGRVKVKLKTSKILDSQPVTSLEAPIKIDADKSSQQLDLEKDGVFSAEIMEDRVSSLPETKIDVSGNLSKKSGSIKIKSSKGLGSKNINQSSSGVIKVPHQNPRYNKQELDDALTVIKKVMKMDAAEPFNAPVNPTALGIPDYFDVIKTPMDFGTICNNLEKGVKYMRSEDVFKDVQYVWENCYKYNNKGDYIVDLMKRVKKNFTKYWTAAGLYNEQPSQINGTEKIQAEEAAPSSQGQVHLKGGQMKNKKGKRHGFKRHKDGCLCAICILKRRRKEREESAKIIEDQAANSENNLNPEMKQEGTSPIESPSGEDTSSNMDNSLDPESEADDLEDRGDELKSEAAHHDSSPRQDKPEGINEMEIQMEGEETPEQSQLGGRSSEDPFKQSQTQVLEESSGGVQTDNEKEETSVQEEDNAAVQQQKSKDSQEMHPKVKLFENLSHFENPMLLELCGTLFPKNHRSVWSGPHSLVRQQSSTRSSAIHAAIETLMKFDKV